MKSGVQTERTIILIMKGAHFCFQPVISIFGCVRDRMRAENLVCHGEKSIVEFPKIKSPPFECL
jgi:hypothetical protein